LAAEGLAEAADKDVGDGRAEISVKKGQHLLSEGDGDTDEIDGALQAGRSRGRRLGHVWERTPRRGHGREALRLSRIVRRRRAAADWKRGSDDALLVCVRELGYLRTPTEAP